MTKYTVASQRRAREAQQGISPGWAAIGCLMMVIVPVGSYLISKWVVDLAVGANMPVPYQLLGNPVLPKELYAVAALIPVWNFIQAQPNLYAVLVVTLLLIVIIGALLSVGWALFYRVAGPPRYGPLDSPPLKTNLKRYKR